MKHAALVGNLHAAARVTPFFDTHSQAADFAKHEGIAYDFIKPISNWKEHQQWNIDKVGAYAESQVNE